jgi:phage tail-like protein
MPKIPGLRADPFPAFRFYITLIDSSSTLAKVMTAISFITNYALGGFSECTGLEMTTDVYEYKEGGRNDCVLKFPTRVEHPNLTLKKGMGFSDDLWLWHYDLAQGKVKRRDGLIALMNEVGVFVKFWHFKDGIPAKWTGPDLNATQNALAIETLEIAHQGLELFSPHRGVSELLSKAF